MTAAVEGVSGQQHASAAIYPWERPGTHFTGRATDYAVDGLASNPGGEE